MKFNKLLLPLLALFMATATVSTAHAVQGPPPPGGWDAPPPDLHSDIERRGFHDGMEGARKDAENHRRPNVSNRDEYRHPSGVPRGMRHAYQAAFERGYQVGVQHFYGHRH